MNVTIEIPMPRLASVEAVDALRIRVTWKTSLRPYQTEVVDLAPLIDGLKFYKTLRNNPALFKTVHLIDLGSAIAWGENDEIDMAATSVERLAEEALTADEFRGFLKTNNLTHAQAAAELGYSRRQIENFLAGGSIPRIVALACYGYAARKQQLQSRMTVSCGSSVRIDGHYLLTETNPPPRNQPMFSSKLVTV